MRERQAWRTRERQTVRQREKGRERERYVASSLTRCEKNEAPESLSLEPFKRVRLFAHSDCVCARACLTVCGSDRPTAGPSVRDSESLAWSSENRAGGVTKRSERNKSSTVE